jgi:hypothetical protein
MSSEERPSAKRAARQATQAAMLASATRILLESPRSDVLGTLKPVEIARRCDPPRTTGAFYNIWATHAEFHRDLLDHLLSMDRFTGDRTTLEMLGSFLDHADMSVPEIFRIAARYNFDELKGEPAAVLQLALWTQHHDPAIRERLRCLYGAINDSLHPLYSRVLVKAGRRMRKPYDVQMLTTTITALVEGFLLRWAVDPDALPEGLDAPPGVDGPEPWELFGTASYLLFESMTEPVDDVADEVAAS